MFNIAICIQLIFHQSIFVQCNIDWIDAEWDEKMMQKGLKCGIENKYEKAQMSRVINGRRTSNIKYPWLAEVVRIVYNPFQNMHRESIGGTGSVISHKAILTAAHNLCQIQGLQRKGTSGNIYCRENDQWSEPNDNWNQNRYANQIHYSIGNMRYFSSDVLNEEFMNEGDMMKKYNNNIKAYVYKFDPEWSRKHFWANNYYYRYGDVGLIIDESTLGLDLTKRQASPICLPSSLAFEGEDMHQEIKVTASGRGKMYAEYKDDEGNEFTSCMTNEGVVKSKLQEHRHIRETFLQCKNYNRDKKDRCIQMKDAIVSRSKIQQSQDRDNEYIGYHNQLLSTEAKIDFLPGGEGSKIRMKIKLPQNDECQKLSAKITESIKKLEAEKQIRFYRDDSNGPSRVVVFDEGESKSDWAKLYTDWEKTGFPNVPYCYNLTSLAEFGICETDSEVYNFGFCSPSCLLEDPFDDDDRKRDYWEVKGIYRKTGKKADGTNGKFMSYS